MDSFTSDKTGRVIGLALLCLLGAFSTPALGCAVCGFGPDPSRWAFVLTTGVLTFAPLLMIGGILLYIRKSARRAAAESDPLGTSR